MNRKYTIIAIIVIILLTLGLSFKELSSYKPKDAEILNLNIKSNHTIKKNETISILTWNIGYAGLGEEADTFIDGGRHFLPKSKKITQNHLKNISEFIKTINSDIYLFQEVGLDTRMTFFINILEKFKETLKEYNSVFAPTVYIENLPIIGRLITGNSIFSKYSPLSSVRVALPLEDKGITGIFNQHYNFIVQRYHIEESSKEWVIINLHLAAFDEGGKIREKQLNHINDFMLDEYNKGNYVVVGGDWNHRLAETSFSYDTSEEYLFWVRDIPDEFTPDGWKWGVDINNPTVRTLERPYVKNGNYTCIIDGFLVSPNVEIVEIKGFDFKFKDTDHNPVLIKVNQKDTKY